MGLDSSGDRLEAALTRLAESQARTEARLERITGVPVVAAVAGERITLWAREQSAALRVWRVQEDRVYSPA